MFSIIVWILYGLTVGMIAKFLHPGDDPDGFLPTMIAGVAGSYMGGAINWAIGMGGSPFSSSGILMGILGGIICLYIYKHYITKTL